jgi:template-activating factor I
MSSSKKRSSPGADTTKNGDPFAEVDIGDAEESILAEYQKKIQRVELILGGYIPQCFCYCKRVLSRKIIHGLPAERRAQEQLTPVYQQRREALKNVPKFWPVALLKHSLLAVQTQHEADRLALSYLEDVWVVRDPREPKVFTLEFVRLACDG